MRKIFILFLFFISLSLFAQNGSIQYLEGSVDIRKSGSDMVPAEIGMSLALGDTVITGLDGFCEVELQGGSSMNIDPDTVFSFQKASVSPEKEPESVFRVAMGKISFKFNQFFGKEPVITTPGTTCGIRGTEFTVIAAADGQSLYVVSDGEVAVESAGQMVSLTTDEAVEASVSGLGEKFPVLRGSLDFSSWRDEAENNANNDPVGILQEMTTLLEDYLNQAEYYYQLYLDNEKKLKELQQQIASLREEGKSDEAKQVVDDQFLPLKSDVVNLIVNYRYYAISAQSLRQFVISSLYIQQRTTNWDDEMNPDFLEAYEKFMSVFEARAIPFYEIRDI